MGSVNISKTRRGESAYLIPTVSLRYRYAIFFLTYSSESHIMDTRKKWVLSLSKVFGLEKVARFFFYFHNVV